MTVISPVSLAGQADFVVVDKANRSLFLFNNGVLVREYPVSLGRNPKGHKRQQGDGRTPEGRYKLTWRNEQSRFYRSIHVDYPNEQDKRWAQSRGVSPGGAIMIHGLPNDPVRREAYYQNTDWTEGCIAVMNDQMDEILELVSHGTPIRILP